MLRLSRARPPTSRAFVSLVLASALWAVPEARAAAIPPGCDQTLPQVLNLGLPYVENLDPPEVQRLLGALFGQRMRGLARCPGQPIQINTALGTDYQILDWVSRGSVDVAVVSPLSLHLLLRDGIDLLEVSLPRSLPGPWLQTREAKLRALDLPRRRERGSPASDFDAFLTGLLERARRGADDPEAKGGARAGGHGDGREAPLGTRIVFPSHLAAAGYLVPVAEAHRWLEARLRGEEAGALEALRSAFWDSFFAHACFRFEAAPAEGGSCRRLSLAGGGTGEGRAAAVELEVLGEAPPKPSADAPGFAFGKPVRDRLVIRRTVAEAVFRPDPEAFPLPGEPLGSAFREIFGSLPPEPEGDSVPGAFRGTLQKQRYFDTRTFSFTADESLRLLNRHQQLSGRPGVALVLPGGGVKAAYQSEILDTLFGAGYLSTGERDPSDGVQGTGSGAAQRPLRLRHVIGTSGGALLGYFVARLGEHGPYDLSHLLWHRPRNGPGSKVEPLDSADVFGFTDLPRYASLVTILLIFCLGLAVCSMGSRCWLAPGPRSQETGSAPTSLRLPILLPMASILFATPLLVRWVSRDLTLEHVPEFEGLLYAVLLVMAMFTDQCVEEGPVEGSRPAGPAPAARRFLWIGLALLVSPALARLFPGLGPVLEGELWAGPAYLGLGTTAAVLMVWALRKRGPERPRPRGKEILAWLLAFAAASAVAYFLLRRVGEGLLRNLDRAPLLFLGLGATLLIAGLVRLARSGGTRWSVLLAQGGSRLMGSAALRRLATGLAPLFVALLTLDLVRPLAEGFGDPGRSLSQHFAAPSKLALPLGGLAVCLGAVLALAGLLLQVANQPARLRLVKVREFVDGVLFLIVGLSLATYALMGLVIFISPTSLTFFELTPQFWIGLVMVSALVTTALLGVAHRYREGGRLFRALVRALRYLCSRHPNAHLISRRFLRMVILAVGGFLWWNVLLAPGIYGNRYAARYLRDAEGRFEEKFRQVHPESGEGAAYGLAVPLLATANALKTDGTHFFLVLPEDQKCPEIRPAPGSGTALYRFHAVTGGKTHAPHPRADTCRDLEIRQRDSDDHRLLRSFVLASGSPFPIFPAHRVQVDENQEKKALVDGGYSNNTPVEAAQWLGSERVLVVNSSNPLPDQCGGSKWLPNLFGPLVANTLELPSLLYQRAQQLDRRSRGNLFVLSLSPPVRCDWPFLSDFRKTTVERMVTAARRDLDLRIGLVEGWGPPTFQVSRQVTGSVRPREPSAEPAE